MTLWSRPEDLVGVELGARFRVIRLLGRGSTGVVYEALHLRLGGRVAVKVLDPHLALDVRERDRFLRQAQAAAQIPGDHAVRIIDMGEHPGPFFAMELLEGRDLAAVLRDRGRLEWSEAQRWMFPVLRALGEAHALGILHRGLRPSNIFVSMGSDGAARVKVLDFGIARPPTPLSDTGELTRTNEMQGALPYLAPEQIMGRPLDRRTDLYAFAVVLFEMLAGRVPFSGSSAYEICDQHMRAARPALKAVMPSVPQAVSDMVRRAMAVEPRDRFGDVAELALAMQQANAGARPATVPVASAWSRPTPEPVASVEPQKGWTVPVVRPSFPGQPWVQPPMARAVEAEPIPEPKRPPEDFTMSGDRSPKSWGRRLAFVLGGAVLFTGLGIAVARVIVELEPQKVPAIDEESTAPSSMTPAPPPEIPAVSVVEATPAKSQEPAATAPSDPVSAPLPDRPAAEEPPEHEVAADRPKKRSPSRPRAKHQSPPATEGAPAEDAVLAELHRQALATCAPSEAVTVTMMVSKEGSVRVASSTPKSPCVEDLARARRFSPSDEPTLHRLRIAP